MGFKLKSGRYRGCWFVYANEPSPVMSNKYTIAWLNRKSDKLTVPPDEVIVAYHLWVKSNYTDHMSWRDFLHKTFG